MKVKKLPSSASMKMLLHKTVFPIILVQGRGAIYCQKKKKKDFYFYSQQDFAVFKWKDPDRERAVGSQQPVSLCHLESTSLFLSRPCGLTVV